MADLPSKIKIKIKRTKRAPTLHAKSAPEHHQPNGISEDPVSDSKTKMTDNSPFPFMELPPELRNSIYYLYFNGIVDRRECWRSFPDGAKHGLPIVERRPYLKLLHSSHNIRSETAPMFYKEYLAGDDVVFYTDCERGLDWHRRMQAFCASIAAIDVNIKIGFNFRPLLTPNETNVRCAQLHGIDISSHFSTIAECKTLPSAFPYSTMMFLSKQLKLKKIPDATFEPRPRQPMNVTLTKTRILNFEMEEFFRRFQLRPLRIRIFGPMANINWSQFKFDYAAAAEEEEEQQMLA